MKYQEQQPKPKDEFLTIRLSSYQKRLFKEKCKKEKVPASNVIRSLVIQFIMDAA